MSAPKRKREVQLNFRVSPEELALIEQKMAQLGTTNREAYLRKMALDGYVVRLELPELKELVSLMRYSSNNLNQLARRAHETGRIYDADLEDISRRQDALWDGVHRILTQLAIYLSEPPILILLLWQDANVHQHIYRGGVTSPLALVVDRRMNFPNQLFLIHGQNHHFSHASFSRQLPPGRSAAPCPAYREHNGKRKCC